MTIEASGLQRISKGLDVPGNNAPRFDASPLAGEVPTKVATKNCGSRHWAGKRIGER
jgi:hypothetical protein